MRLYTVYDHVAEVHGPVFEQPNDRSAVRNLERMLVTDKSKLPSDYSVRCIGEFFPDTGRIQVFEDVEDLKPQPASMRYWQDEMDEALVEGGSSNG